MEQLINNMRPYLEALYFLSGIAVALAAFLALKQIRLMKRDIVSRSERAAKEKAIEAAFEFAKLHDVFQGRLVYLDEPLHNTYTGPVGDFTPDSIPTELKERAKLRQSSGAFIQPLNLLNGIAAMFVSGVADEKTAFPIFGRAFCGTVSLYYDVISMARKSQPHTPYSNCVELYQIWSARLSKEELELARRNLEKQIENISDKEIPPLSPLPEEQKR